MESPLPLDPYETLNVVQDASLATIRHAYRKLFLTCHPDRFRDRDEAVRKQKDEQFHEVQEAYETLSDNMKRQRYDERLRLAKLRAKLRASIGISREQETHSGRSDHYSSSKTSSPLKYPNINTTPHQRSLLLNELRRCPGPLSRARCREISIQTGLTEEIVKVWHRKRFELLVSELDKENAEVKQDACQLPWKTDRFSKNRNTITALEGMINGTPVCALPDTGADLNFMAAAFATDSNLEFTPYSRGQERLFVLGHGRTIKATGQLTVTWQFKSEPDQSYAIVIYILPCCIFDVLIGAKFLYATKTMCTHRDRLSNVPRPRRALLTRVVNLCGLPSRRLQGTLNEQECTALPDSGAEPNLLSYEYVKRRGWLLDMYPGPESCRLLQFADGSTERTDGRLKLEWSFNNRWEPASSDSPLVVTFDVLRGCSFDVILGKYFLQETEAFVKHNKAFIDISVERAGGINMVIFAADFLQKTLKSKKKRKAQHAEWTENVNSDEFHQELERRAKTDRIIATTKNDPKTHARGLAIEAQRRIDWEREHPVVPLKVNPQDPSTPSQSPAGAHVHSIPIKPSTTQPFFLSAPKVDRRGISLDPFDARTHNHLSQEPPDKSTSGQSSPTTSRDLISVESNSSSPRPSTLRRMRKFCGRTSEERPLSKGDQQAVPFC